jgi:hypothetical protein
LRLSFVEIYNEEIRYLRNIIYFWHFFSKLKFTTHFISFFSIFYLSPGFAIEIFCIPRCLQEISVWEKMRSVVYFSSEQEKRQLQVSSKLYLF